MMSSTILRAARRIRGEITVPGDKSLSHRAALIAAVAEGTSHLINFSTADDCRRTLDCLQALGVSIHRQGSQVEITGRGLGGFRPAETVLDAGNSGSTLRMLLGILAGQPFTTTITGDDSLRRRPMDRVIGPLQQMGATITAVENCFAPLTIQGGPLRPLTYRLPIPSAQVKSALLLAGLYAEGVTTIMEPIRSRDHTEIMLREFGAHIVVHEGRISLAGRPTLVPRMYSIGGDPSAAAFFIGAAAMLPDSDLVVRNVLLNPTRRGFLDVLTAMGVTCERLGEKTLHGECVADLRVRSSPRSLHQGSDPFLIHGGQVPLLIDEIPLLAVVATQTAQGMIIRDARELRVKESDRIRAIVENLRRMGAHVTEQEDGMVIPGNQKLRGADIDPAGDHRIAMAFAIAGLVAEGETIVRHSDVVSVSFPEFFSLLDRIVYR